MPVTNTESLWTQDPGVSGKNTALSLSLTRKQHGCSVLSRVFRGHEKKMHAS